MAVDPKHSNPDLGAVTIPELEEHGHIGGVESGTPFKHVYEPPTSMAIDEASSTVTYVGYAILGTATSAASWQIKKISISGTVTRILWADGNSFYDNIWDDRATLSYS